MPSPSSSCLPHWPSLSYFTPAPARADLPVIGPLGGGVTGPLGGGVTGLLGGVANDIFVKGFGTLLQFIFGKALTDLAQSFLKDLLDVTPLSGPKAPAGLGQLHDAIEGAAGTSHAQLHRGGARLLALQLHL